MAVEGDAKMETKEMSESKYIHTMIKIKDKELTIIVPDGIERVIIESAKGWTVDGVAVVEKDLCQL